MNAGSWRTNRFFKGNVPKKHEELRTSLNNFAENFGFIPSKKNSDEGKLKTDKLNENLLRNDVKNLYILFWFQRKYYIHAMWTRRLNLYSIISLGAYFVIFFIFLI